MINDTFKRICVRAQAAVQNTSTSTSNANDLLPKVKDWSRTRYDRIMRSFPWNELVRNYSLSVTASTRDYALRYDLASIIKFWDTTHGQEITERTIQDHVRHVAPVLEVTGNVTTGQPENYINIGSKGVSALLSTADQVQVVSTSASDISPVVIRIRGEVSGVEVSESITLTGTTAANSTNTFDSGAELFVTCGTSDGTLQDLAGVVTVREKTTTSNTLAKLPPGERSPLYRWIRLSPTPASALTAQIWYKKKWPALVNDNDAPIVPCANEIIEGVIADALWEDGQETGAQAQETKFTNSVNELWMSSQSRNLIKQFVPDNGEGGQLYPGRIFENGSSY
jgi:hypothetical protein